VQQIDLKARVSGALQHSCYVGAGCIDLLQAVTLPAPWYTSPVALQLEKQHVLFNGWQVWHVLSTGLCDFPAAA
jgi:hypothetical protein